MVGRRLWCVVFGWLAVLAPSGAWAGWVGPGCWNCEPIGLVGAYYICKQAGNNGEGEGTNCYQGDIMGPFCYTNGVACFNIDVNGGAGSGGGSGSGGSGGNCVVPMSAVCPAECESCSRELF